MEETTVAEARLWRRDGGDGGAGDTVARVVVARVVARAAATVVELEAPS